MLNFSLIRWLVVACMIMLSLNACKTKNDKNLLSRKTTSNAQNIPTEETTTEGLSLNIYQQSLIHVEDYGEHESIIYVDPQILPENVVLSEEQQQDLIYMALSMEYQVENLEVEDSSLNLTDLRRSLSQLKSTQQVENLKQETDRLIYSLEEKTTIASQKALYKYILEGPQKYFFNRMGDKYKAAAQAVADNKDRKFGFDQINIGAEKNAFITKKYGSEFTDKLKEMNTEYGPRYIGVLPSQKSMNALVDVIKENPREGLHVTAVLKKWELDAGRGIFPDKYKSSKDSFQVDGNNPIDDTYLKSIANDGGFAITYNRVNAVDRSVVSATKLNTAITLHLEAIKSKKHALVHCKSGQGRSGATLVGAEVMILMEAIQSAKPKHKFTKKEINELIQMEEANAKTFRPEIDISKKLLSLREVLYAKAGLSKAIPDKESDEFFSFNPSSPQSATTQ